MFVTSLSLYFLKILKLFAYIYSCLVPIKIVGFKCFCAAFIDYLNT